MPSPQPSNASTSSNLLSPTSPTLSQPAWPAPRSPLPPHRLAKLANALGVSTPVPATHAFTLAPTSPTVPPPGSAFSSPAFPDFPRRSPTPSPSLGLQLQPTSTASASKFLLHVIPPYHLPHELDADELDPDLAPPPPSAAGYHAQFRRGVLVPVYPTLQAQLGAIAREYALPSTVGLVLYLVSAIAGEPDAPGPRISDDIWKHVWSRVLKAEKDDVQGAGPRPFGLGFGVAGRSSPALIQDRMDSTAPSRAQTPAQMQTPSQPAQNLRALISPRRPDIDTALSPSPSTSAYSYSSQSELEAGSPESATSVDPSTLSHSNSQLLSLPLPGLESPSLLPILAKVEFDVDRRKAGWYDPWVRSRKINGYGVGSRRAESRLGGASRSASRLSEREKKDKDEDEDSERKAPMDLTLVEKMERTRGVPEFLVTRELEREDREREERERELEREMERKHAERNGERVAVEVEERGAEGYNQLEESDDEDEEELTARLNVLRDEADPLGDVFGDDAETWAAMRASRVYPRSTQIVDPDATSDTDDEKSESHARDDKNPNFVPLTLDASDLEHLPPLEHGDDASLPPADGTEEIAELLKRMSQSAVNKPTLSVAIPTPADEHENANGNAHEDENTNETADKMKRRSSPTTAGTVRKHVPPPLNLMPQANGNAIADVDNGGDDSASESGSEYEKTRDEDEDDAEEENGNVLIVPRAGEGHGGLSPAPVSAAESVQLAYLKPGATPVGGEHPVDVQRNEEEVDEKHEDDAHEHEKHENGHGDGQEKRRDDGQEESQELEVSADTLLLGKSRSPEEEKRDGAFFDDLDLGLDPSMETEFDDSDPFDHRRSQVILAAQLDEIEKNLAQFSPRQLRTEDLKEEIVHRRMQSAASTRSFRPTSVRSMRALSPPMESSPIAKTPTSGAAWPAVPYSTLNELEEDDDAPTAVPADHTRSPPKFAFNGISTEPPRSPYVRRARSGTVSDETLARQRALEEEQGLYPPLGAARTNRGEDSPVIPLSPDPFGRYPSVHEAAHAAATAANDTEDERRFLDEPLLPMPDGMGGGFLERGSPLAASGGLGVPSPDLGMGMPLTQANVEDEGRPPSQTPSSRFSLDSVTSEEATKAVKQPSSSSSLMSVKTIRRLWKKSSVSLNSSTVTSITTNSNSNNSKDKDKRSSVSTLAPGQPDREKGRTSPNTASAELPPPVPVLAPAPAGRTRAKSIVRPPPPPPLDLPPLDTRGLPMSRDVHIFRFDQDSPYPIHSSTRNSSLRSPSPPPSSAASLSRPPSQLQYYSRPPSQQAHHYSRPSSQQAHHARPPSVSQTQMQVPSSAPPEKTGMRKSILKSWKSATGLSGGGKAPSSHPTSTTPRSSTEQLPDGQAIAKKRRPSVLGIATGGFRGSMSGSSSSATLVEIPPSPALPEHLASQNQRSSSRLSQRSLTHAPGRPSVSSSGSASSPPRVRSPLSPIIGTTPPSANSLNAVRSRPSFESFDSRSSFDVSQFEIVSPPRGSLTYPYHGLDQSVLSHE